MAIIFDEVTADVQSPPASAPAAPQPSASGPRTLDPHALLRALTRQAERQARLTAD